MAGRIRIKVSLEGVDPFWMFIDTEKNPLIANIQEKIDQRLNDSNAADLFLDGCLLPPDETSELLRDGDMVTAHVVVSECEDQPDVSMSTKSKIQRKRKHSRDRSEHMLSDNQAGISTPKQSRKKKSKKDKLVASSARKSQKFKARKQRKKKTVAALNIDDAANGDDAVSTPVAENKTSETLNTEIAPEMTANSTPIPQVTDLSAEKRKRRRRGRKKATAGSQSKVEQDSAKTLTAMQQTPAELKVPKWQKGQNTKIVFSSGGESADESGANVSVSQVGNQEADKSHDTVSQASAQLDISDYNSSFSECFPSSNSLSLNKSSLVQREISMDAAGDAERSNARAESNTAVQVPDENMPEDVNGSVSVNEAEETEKHANEENWDDEWYRDQQYQGKLAEEKSLKRKCPSALSRSVNPVHLYTGGRHEVVQPDLTEYLKMSPEERGVEVPPYVTATRLSNGAMLYTRSPVAFSTDSKSKPSPFKKPAAYSPARSSPRALSKQQQLDTVNINKSVVIQNSSPSSAKTCTAEKNARSGNFPAEEGVKLADGQETIVLTPVGREYSCFADLTVAPKVGDQIAYKVLEMGENYAPGISNYKEAEVLGYDSSTQNVTVKILHFSPKKKTPGKFDLPDENDVEEEVTLELSSMFEVKLISSG